MTSSPTLRRSAGPPRGVIRTRTPPGTIDHRRLLPADDLAHAVAHFWWVSWKLHAPFVAETLPHPTVHVVVERSTRGTRAGVAGVARERFTRRLREDGWVFGIKFRPAMFQPLWRAPMTTLRGRVVALRSVFGSAGDAFARAALAADSLDARIVEAETFLRTVMRPAPPPVVLARDLVERAESDRDVLTVARLAAIAGVDVRTLERSFRTYVGAAPKWVVRRYRLHEAAERLSSADAPSLVALASSLGYADQAHFTRDFKATVGQTPMEYLRRSRRAR